MMGEVAWANRAGATGRGGEGGRNEVNMHKKNTETKEPCNPGERERDLERVATLGLHFQFLIPVFPVSDSSQNSALFPSLGL